MKKIPLAIAIASALLSHTAMAYDAGDILVRARLINVVPDESSSDLSLNGATLADSDVQVTDNLSLDIDFTYMLSPNWGVELLLDISSQHTVRAKGNTLRGLGVSKVGSARVLPPSLIMQYHFLPNNPVKPYAGIGINYTHFFDEKLDNDVSTGLAGSDLILDDSWGLVGQVGADIDIGNDWFLNVDLKYIDMNSDTSFDILNNAVGVDVDIDINPWIFGIGIGTRF